MAATNKRGVFSLEKVLERQGDNNWTNIFDPFIYVISVHPATTAGPTTGYFAGGYSPGSYDSRVDRIDYTNDSATASPKGNLSTDQAYVYGGASSTSHGYVFGGQTSPQPYSTIVNRIDYGNDTATASPKGPLSVGRNKLSSVGNANYGYAGGGYNGPSWNQTSIIDRVDYSSDTGTMTSVNPAGMTPGGYMTISAGNQSYGYWAGGYEYWTIGGYVSIVRRLDYASDTSATAPKGPMTQQGGDGAATGNANYGYFKTSGNTGSAIERIDYSNDTATLSSRGGVLTYTAYKRGATGSAAYGYFGGGASPDYSFVDRIDYSNDTAAASPKGKLTVPKYEMGTFSSREYGMPQTNSERSVTPATESERTIGPAYGYYAGGMSTPAGNQSKILRLDYSNDTVGTAWMANLPTTLYYHCSTGNGSFGYTFGGTTPSISNSSVTYRVDYASDATNASSKGYLYRGISYSSAIGNSNYAYINSGLNPNQNELGKFDYANDSSTATSLGNIFNPATYANAAVGNSNYGYFIGGIGGGDGTQVRRLDYSNDTAPTSPRGPLSSVTSYCGATGNLNFGYVDIYDGYNAPYSTSSTTRIEYANDTATSSPKGKLVDSQYGPQFRRKATGDGSYGYWFGGTQPNSAQSTTNSRLDFSNDTATATPKGTLSTPLTFGSAFSGRENQFSDAGKITDKGSEGMTSPRPAGYGYIMGGDGGPAGSNNPAQKINFANDTATATQKAAPALPGGPAKQTTSVGNHNYAYSTNGRYNSCVHRLDYANDTAQMLNKGARSPSSPLGYEECATGNLNYGYINGGYANYTFPAPGSNCPGSYSYAPNVTNIYRIDYANDTNAAALKSYNTNSGGRKGACGNNDFGYWLGGDAKCSGSSGGSTTYVERTDYASDTTNSVRKGDLPTATQYSRGQGYTNYGYCIGSSSYRSHVFRVDYANDTATAVQKGNLSRDYYKFATTGNAVGGYAVSGAQGGPNVTSTDRIDYSNDTATASPKGPLAVGVQEASGVSASENGLTPSAPNFIPRVRFIDLVLEGTGATPEVPESVAGPAYGYWAGGQGAPSSYHIDRLDFENDTATGTPKGQLMSQTVRGGGTGNMTHGYTFGGSGAGSRVQRVDYANDTATASQRGPLWSPSGDYMSSVGNNDYGYTGARPWSYTGHFGKVDYANDTATETQLGGPSTFYPGPGYYGYGACGNLNYGYFVGGASSRVRRCDYSNDTAQLSLRGPLTANSNYATATGNGNFGYVDNPGYYLSRIDYSNDTANAVQKGPMTGSGPYKAACGTASYGYWAGGTSVSPYCLVSRLDYANDTAAGTPKGPLSVGMYRQTAFSARENGKPSTNSPYIPESLGVQAPFQPPFPFPVQAHNPSGNFSYGYFGGGSNPSGPSPSSRSIIDRIQYANDTLTATPKGTLSPAFASNYTYRSTGVSGPLFGYLYGFAGGDSRADRIDYSNDTATASNINLLVFGSGSGSAGNANHGYIAGGDSHKTNITRINYSNETTTSAANLTESRTSMYGAAGNQSYGYFMGGYNPAPGPGYLTSVERLDYSSDTTTPTVKGPLNVGRQNFFGGVGNANYGYIGGGSPPFELSSVERIDFNNDTATASPKGPLSTTKQFISGTGTTSYGYVAGGEQNNPSYATFSTIDRIDFASDTATASPKGPLSEAKMGTGSVSAATNAKTP